MICMRIVLKRELNTYIGNNSGVVGGNKKKIFVTILKFHTIRIFAKQSNANAQWGWWMMYVCSSPHRWWQSDVRSLRQPMSFGSKPNNQHKTLQAVQNTKTNTKH